MPLLTPERQIRQDTAASSSHQPGLGSLHSCLYEGSVRHRRMGKVNDEFHYPLFMAYLDLAELPQCFDGRWLWSARRPALAWFRRSDYLGDPHVSLAEEVRDLVKERTGRRPEGPIRLLTHLRYFGKSFNPVSFYYCFDEHGERVVAVVADVTNTPWGERHAYVMGVEDATDHGTVKLMRAQFDKRLHVSPLMGMDHTYDWRLTEPGEQLLVHIESHRAGAPQHAAAPQRADGPQHAAAPQRADGPQIDGGPPHADGPRVFDATLTLNRRELTPRAMRGALLRYPFLTARILARIYTHALRLKLRGARYFPHPEKIPPENPHAKNGALQT